MRALATRNHSAEQLARDWFVRLREADVSLQEVAAWEAWLGESPEHGEAYDAVAEVWALASEIAVEPAPRPQLWSDRYDGSTSVRAWRSRRRPRPWLAWSAAAVVACSLFGLLALHLQTASNLVVHKIATLQGQHKEAVLPDGSTMVLGGRTALEVGYTPSRRNVVLSSGEALFKVAHQSNRPFVVKTKFGDFRAVGTAFTVDLGAGSVQLVVTEGVVSVESPLGGTRAGWANGVGHLRVSAGQRLLMDAAGIRIESGYTDGPAWLDGRLEYRNEPLALVLEDINRYSEKPVRLADPAMGVLTFTGTVYVDDIGAWAEALEGAFPLAAESLPNGEIILRRKGAARAVVAAAKPAGGGAAPRR